MKKSKLFNYLLSAIVAAYLLTLMFPGWLFSEKLTYKNFTAYYHANTENPVDTEHVKAVLDKTDDLLKRTPLYDSEVNQAFFISNSAKEFTFFSPSARKAFAINFPMMQNIFVAPPDIVQDSITTTNKEHNTRSMSSVLAHETVHSLLESHLGIVKYKLLPRWKNEGYADFIANESSYDAMKGVHNMCNQLEDNSHSFKYFKYRLMTAYLFEDEQITLDDFLKKDFDVTELNRKVRSKWCK